MNPQHSLFCALARACRLLWWLILTALRLQRLERHSPDTRQAILNRAVHDCLRIFNVQIHAHPAPRPLSGHLIAANHVSWLDILVLMSLYPTRFIAMKELQNWFIVGNIIRNAGTVFIDRRNRKDIDPINTAIADILMQGGNVCFFPEARTSLGNGVLPLKAALFQSALLANAPVQAVALRYYDATKQRTERVSFASIAFPLSLWRVLKMREIHVHADCAEALTPAQRTPDTDRFALKEQVSAFLNEKVLADSPNPQRL